MARRLLCRLLGSSRVAFAGPPYLTDDPDPVPVHHWELYSFLTKDQTRSTDTATGPALELNNGIAANTQLHLIVPDTYVAGNGNSGWRNGGRRSRSKIPVRSETKGRPEIGAARCWSFQPAIDPEAWATDVPGSRSQYGCKRAMEHGQPMAAAVTRITRRLASVTTTMEGCWCSAP